MDFNSLDGSLILSQLVRSGNCCLVRLSDDLFSVCDSIPEMFKLVLAHCDDFGVMRFKNINLTFIVKPDDHFYVLGVTRYLEVDEVSAYSYSGTGRVFVED